VLSTHSYLRFVPSPEENDSRGSDVGDDTVDTDTPSAGTAVAQNPLNPFTLDAAIPNEASHRAFLLALAEVDQHRGENVVAVQELDAALRLHPPAAQANQLKARVDTLRVSLSLAAENAQRRPAIQPSVVQGVIVRPRLRALPEVHP
jgi:hypothetical protein